MLRPKLEFPYERGAEDALGTVLWAVIAGRLKLLCGGRGTDRGVAEVGVVSPPDLAVVLPEPSESDRMPLCGGRGMLWFIAICTGSECDGAALRLDIAGVLPARLAVDTGLELPTLCCGRGTKRPPGPADVVVCRGAGVRVAPGVTVLRTSSLCKAASAGDGFDEILGGVMRLTVGLEATDEDGCAAAAPLVGPSILARVGETSGLPMRGAVRKALGETLTAFAATGSPRSKVFRDTAVNAPGLLA
jgi:hypothetical protein